MKASDAPRFAGALRVLAETFRCEATDGMIEGYRIGLGDLAIVDLERAIKRALRECKFMPSPSELRDLTGNRVSKPYYREWKPEPAALREVIARSWLALPPKGKE